MTPPCGVPASAWESTQPVFEHARVQPLADEAQQHAVAYPAAQDFPQSLMVQGVEELANVDLQDPSAAILTARSAGLRSA